MLFFSNIWLFAQLHKGMGLWWGGWPHHGRKRCARLTNCGTDDGWWANISASGRDTLGTTNRTRVVRAMHCHIRELSYMTSTQNVFDLGHTTGVQSLLPKQSTILNFSKSKYLSHQSKVAYTRATGRSRCVMTGRSRISNLTQATFKWAGNIGRRLRELWEKCSVGHFFTTECDMF